MVGSVLESAFAQAPIGMALVDMTGRMLLVNDAFCRITGYTAEQACARSFRDLSDQHEVDVDGVQHLDLLAGRVQAYHVETRIQHARGHLVQILVSVSLIRDAEGHPLNLIAQVQDISERKALEARLEYLVDHDFLTGLFNARRFAQALVQETKSAARYDGGGAVLLLDLDHFKAVNDQFGHKAGDDLLKTVAVALQRRVRDTDVLARLGGDEFGIILPQVDAAQAKVVAEGIVETLPSHITPLVRDRIPVTASVGVAPFDGLTNVDVLAAADFAMYQAKHAGRNRLALYRPSSDAWRASSPRHRRQADVFADAGPPTAQAAPSAALIASLASA